MELELGSPARPVVRDWREAKCRVPGRTCYATETALLPCSPPCFWGVLLNIYDIGTRSVPLKMQNVMLVLGKGGAAAYPTDTKVARPDGLWSLSVCCPPPGQQRSSSLNNIPASLSVTDPCRVGAQGTGETKQGTAEGFKESMLKLRTSQGCCAFPFV